MVPDKNLYLWKDTSRGRKLYVLNQDLQLELASEAKNEQQLCVESFVVWASAASPDENLP